MDPLIARRRVLQGAGAALLASTLPGCATIASRTMATVPAYRCSMDRVIGVTVCSRPFRAAGPRNELERVGLQNIVHSYGHGGSGWSLSWGNGEVVTQLALGTGERDIGVVGCGAIGLTSAIQLQRAGAQVTIYARELPPQVLSNLATGVWSPGSRIGMAESLTPAFKQQWQAMTRASWRMYGGLLGLPGTPVEFYEGYGLRDTPPPVNSSPSPRTDPRPAFAELDRELVPEIGTRSVQVDAGTTPFAPGYIRKGTQLMFNLPAYTRLLLADFRAAGGRVVIDEIRTPADFARLPHRTVVNATGIGARALLGDQSVIPVRGQLTHMIPQAGISYGIQYKNAAMTPRRDGFVLQFHGDGDYFGYDIPTREPDLTEAQTAVDIIASAFKRGAA